MKKFKLCLFLALTSLFAAQTVMADCLPAYQEKIGKFEQFINPSRGAMVGTGISGAVSMPALASAGLLATGTIITSGAAVAGLGITYGILTAVAASYKNPVKLLSDSKKGRGKQLRRMVRQLERKLDMEIDSAEVARLVIEGFQNDTFCPYNENKGKEVPMTFRKIRKQLMLRFI